MLDYGKRNEGFAWVPKQSSFRNVAVYLLDGLGVISPDGSKLGIPLVHGVVTEKGEDPIARISQPAMGRSVKLVHEAEAVCVAACPIGLDEALVEIFDIRRPQAKVLAHMVEIGQVSCDAPDEVPVALRVAPVQCGGCLGSNLLNYPDPSKLLGR